MHDWKKVICFNLRKQFQFEEWTQTFFERKTPLITTWGIDENPFLPFIGWTWLRSFLDNILPNTDMWNLQEDLLEK